MDSSSLLESTYTRGRDGKFLSPTPFRMGWFATIASASPRSAAASSTNPFSSSGAARPALGSGTARPALGSGSSAPSPLAFTAALTLSPRKAAFTPGRTLLEQSAEAGGASTWRALTDHLRVRPSPTH